MLNAGAAVGVFPVLLDHPVIVAEALVELGSSGLAGGAAQSAGSAGAGGAEVEVALVAVFIAAAIEPGIEVGIGNGFFLFVRQNVDESIRATHAGSRAVGAGCLNGAGGLAAVGVADKGPLDVLAAESLMSVEAAELRAEALFAHSGISNDHVQAVGIGGQSIAEGAVDDVSELGVGQPSALRAGVKNRAAQGDVAADVANGVTIGRVDLFVRRVAQAVDVVLHQRGGCRSVGAGSVPVAVEDHINRHRIAFEHGAAIVVDTVAGHYGAAVYSGSATGKETTFARGVGVVRRHRNCRAITVRHQFLARIGAFTHLLCGKETNRQNHKEKSCGVLFKGS